MKLITQNGSTFLQALGLIATASYLSLFAVTYSLEKLELQKEDILADRIEWEDIKSVFDKIPGASKSSLSNVACSQNKKRMCLRRNENYKFLQNAQDVSGITLPDKSYFPQFNFNAIFDAHDLCGSIKVQESMLTSSGKALSKSSSIWDETCIFDGASATGEIRELYNIETVSPILLKGNIFAISGYLNVENSLTAAGDLVILAGGDVLINTLISSGFNLTIISTTGLISISDLQGMPKLKTISKYGAFIKGESLYQESPLLPEMSDLQVLGIN